MQQGKQLLTEKISSLCTEISKLEKDWQGRSRSIKPRENEVSDQEKYLDALARLLTTKKEACMAVCYDKNKKSLLIAGNRRDLGYAREVMDCLQALARDCSSEIGNWSGYYKLIKLIATEQIKIPTGGDSNQVQNKRKVETKNLLEQEEKLEKENKLNEFLVLVDSYRREVSSSENFSQDKWEKLVGEVFEEIKLYEKEEKRKEDWLKYLLPFEDLEIISEAIRTNKLDSQIVQAIKDDLINYIECENIEYCKGCGKKCRGRNLCGKKKFCDNCKYCKEMNLHAEMKIISNLSEEAMENYHYIGITKLACLPCQVTIDILNEFTDFSSTNYKRAVNICGTHGSTYDRWMAPNMFPLEGKQEELQKKIFVALQRIKEDWEKLKLHEISANFPQELLTTSASSNHERKATLLGAGSSEELTKEDKTDRIKKIIVDTRDTFSKTILDRYITFEEQIDVYQRSQKMEIDSIQVPQQQTQDQILQPPCGIPGSSKNN